MSGTALPATCKVVIIGGKIVLRIDFILAYIGYHSSIYVDTTFM